MKDKDLDIMFLPGPLKILVVSQVLTEFQLEMQAKLELMFLTTVREDAMDKLAGDHFRILEKIRIMDSTLEYVI